MKKVILIIGIVLSTLSAMAQGTPPVLVTNVVAFTPTTALRWNPEINSIGYWATMKELPPSTNQWSLFTSTTNILLAALNPGIRSGTYRFEVKGVNSFGQEGPPGILQTNLSILPTIIINIQIIQP